MHSLWIDWRETTVRTTAMLVLAGALKDIEPDAHTTFDEVFAPPPEPAARRPRTPQEIEARRAVIARLAAQ